MSREFIFYPGIKKDGKYNCYHWTKEGKPADVYWASGSFIDGDWFLNNGKQLKPLELHEDIADEFTWSLNEDTPFEERECFLYEFTPEILAKAKPNHGLLDGYIPIEELAIFGRLEDENKQDYVAYEMSAPISASIVAELPPKAREKYGKFAFVDTYSAGYVSQVLSEVLFCMHSYRLDGEACILMLYSF